VVPAGIKISIITATWNCATTVAECLASVASQTHLNREHIVIDGASNDGTKDILKQHQAQLAVLVSEPDNGIYDALNKGLGRATGDIVGFLHADDVFHDAGVLARVAEAFLDHDVCAVYGDLEYVSKDDTEYVVRRWRSRAFDRRYLARGWMPPHPTLYVRRKIYEDIGGFDPDYKIAADYLSVLQLFSQPGFKAVYLPMTMVRMRLGGVSNRSLKHIITKSREDYRALRKTRVGGISALAWKNLSKLRQFST
jgi:glycosyltransferase involved in cell wall biosynthesis